MNTVPAIFENGVFRPTVPVDLPEKTLVEVVLSPITADPFDSVRQMISQGALELDDGPTVSAEEVFSEIDVRRIRIQNERANSS